MNRRELIKGGAVATAALATSKAMSTPQEQLTPLYSEDKHLGAGDSLSLNILHADRTMKVRIVAYEVE